MDSTDAEPDPVDPAAADGLPETADDNSYADDTLEQWRDVTSPGPLPPDREDGPMGLDEYGTTPGELGRTEPLDVRLAREEPEVEAGTAPEDTEPRLAEESDQDAADQLAEDNRMLAETEPVHPHLGSAVSMYDRDVPGIPYERPVGGLYRPGGGYRSTEADEVAYDAGEIAEGTDNEELAMHEVPEERADLDEQESTEPNVSDQRARAGTTGAGAQPPAARAEPRVRTGAEQPWDPEDLAVAEGRDPTPANVERARRELEELGPAAIEKTVP